MIALLRDEYLKSAEEVIIKLKSYQKEQKKEFMSALVDGKLGLKFKKAFEAAKRKELDVKIVLLERNRRCTNALSQFGEVFLISLKRF